MNTLFLLLDGAAANPQKQSSISMWIMLGLLIVVFYFFMIRPQQKQQKLLKNFRENLKVGDRVLTNSGMYGKVVQIKPEEKIVIVEVDANVKIKFDINAIMEAPGEKKEETK